MAWDPITRIVGSLGIYTKIDWAAKRVVECHSTSSVFRGYSIFMKGKDPRDAHFITSRICGICGDNHATCSVYAQNMAYGVRPPHLGEWIINLGEAAEYMFDHNIFQENLVGVDYCEKMVAETNPGVLELANRTEAPHAGDHGYKTIGDIMRSLNPLEGEFYREALQVSRSTREMFCLMEGRHVHPSTLYPGGVGTVATVQLFTDYLTRLMRYVEFMKRCLPMHDDLFDFFYEALPGYEEVGRRRVLLGCWGSLNDPEYCDFTYENMESWGRKMFVTPGHGRRRQARHDQPARHQPRHPRRRTDFAAKVPAFALGLVEAQCREVFPLLTGSPADTQTSADLVSALATFTVVPRFWGVAVGKLLHFLREGDARSWPSSPRRRCSCWGTWIRPARSAPSRRRFAIDVGRLLATRGDPDAARGLPYADVERVYLVSPAPPELEASAHAMHEPVAHFRNGLAIPFSERQAGELGALGEVRVLFPTSGQFLSAMSNLTPAQLEVELADRLDAPQFGPYVAALRVQQATLRTAVYLLAGTDQELAPFWRHSCEKRPPRWGPGWPRRTVCPHRG